jgi:hypothetical protein
MRKLNYSKIRRSAQADLRKYERLGVKIFTEALKLQAVPNPSPLPMQKAYVDFYQAVFVDSAKKEFNRIRQDNREKAFVPDEFFLNTWREWIKDWTLQNLGTLITAVNDNTREKIQAVLGEGVEQGLNPFQIERLLLDQIPDPKRARAIARTESTRAFNEGKKKSAEDWSNQTGTNLWKLWIHGGAREPRIQHIQAQDKPIPANSFFEFTSPKIGVVQMDKPGDIKGGAAQTVNCSCVVVYISESYARRNFPDAFTGQPTPVKPIDLPPTITNLNPTSVTNTQLKEELIYSTQNKEINKKVNDILAKSDGVNEMMNQNGASLAIRTPAQSTKNGHFKFVKELGYNNFNDAFLLSTKIGGAMPSNAFGTCSSRGTFINIKIKKGDVVEFKPVKLELDNADVENLLKSGYKKGSVVNGVTTVYEEKTRSIIGYIEPNGEFRFWSLTTAMNSQARKSNIAATITHESAHMMQAWKDRDLSGWKNILSTNGLSPKDAITEYGKTNFQELFAETYSAFVYDNEALKRKNPNLFNTFVQYLERIGVDINTIQIAK